MAERGESDRRKYRRYDLQKPMFVVLRPDFEVVGKLTNISAGGMAFEYNAFGGHRKVEQSMVDVFSHPSEVVLMKAPCRIVYDHEIEAFTGSMECQSRRCGVEFCDLSERQQGQLKKVLEMQASATLPDEGPEGRDNRYPLVSHREPFRR
ncbi:MAG: PilZ domain-containing protein [Deltaproteobacteria bacterium]|nr:PilZ domain-containing protein [Deltaproteobacteria bacterium]